MTESLTWSCHVCGAVRPDASISVLNRQRILAGVAFEENVRYCNDNPVCIEAAKAVRFVGDAEDVGGGE